jgi:site-specific recombinase XerC
MNPRVNVANGRFPWGQSPASNFSRLARPARANSDALVFSTDTGTPFDRHNLVNRQRKPTCKKLGLAAVSWHWLRHANATLLDAAALL